MPAISCTRRSFRGAERVRKGNMDKSKTYMRVATPDDAAAILEIYAPYVRNTAITFEYDVPSVFEFRKRIENTLEKYPYIVAVKEDEIIGYAYIGAFVGRAAYNWSAETTVYLRGDKKKLGLGRMLYQAIERISAAQNILNLNACIGVPESEDEYLTRNSVDFHTHMGYSLVGEFHKCGFKFGRWYDMVWMEKIIGKHDGNPALMIPFSKLNTETIAMLLR